MTRFNLFFRRFPLILSLAAFAVLFYLIARVYSGANDLNQAFDQFLNAFRSIGIFVIAIPFLTTCLFLQQKDRSFRVQLIGQVLQFLSVVSSIIFLLGFSHREYFGIEQSPIKGSFFFYSAILSGGLFCIFEIVTQLIASRDRKTHSLPALFLAATTAFGLGLSTLQWASVTFGELPNLYAITIPGRDFLYQMLETSAFVVLFANQRQSKVLIFSSLCYLFGFQTSNELNVAIFAVGFTGYLALTVSAAFLKSELRSASILTAIVLFIGLFTTLTPLRNVITVQVLNSLRLLILVFILPITSALILPRLNFSSRPITLLSGAMIGLGIITAFGSLAWQPFDPNFEITLAGGFFMLLGSAIWSFEQFLLQVTEV